MKQWIKVALLTLAAIIVLPVVALRIAGALPDSDRMVTSTVIRQKPEVIWPWLYQSDKVKQWVSWLIEIREQGTGEPAAAGSAVWVLEDRNNGNMRMEVTGTVEAVEPNRRIAIRLSAPGGFRGSNVYTLTPLPNGSTRLDSDSRYVFDSAFARFMSSLIYWQAKKKMLGDLEQLRAHLEGGA
jgi:uncharacterized protein YndB with AHSA1/START domain